MKIELIDVTLSSKPKMYNLRSLGESLHNFSYTFRAGKSYAVVGGLGSGNWALSYMLAGKAKAREGQIKIDDQLVFDDVFKEYGWYVGEGLRKRAWLGKELTVRAQLNKTQLSVDIIDQMIEMFELSPSRMDRPIQQISNERWNASSAIGLSQGKRIYGFPWLSDEVKQIIAARLHRCSNILTRNNGIVVIPVQSRSIVEQFVDDIIDLNEQQLPQ